MEPNLLQVVILPPPQLLHLLWGNHDFPPLLEGQQGEDMAHGGVARSNPTSHSDGTSPLGGLDGDVIRVFLYIEYLAYLA